MKTEIVVFDGVKIHFAELKTGEWMVPIKFIGQALGYSGGGQKLCDLVLARWAQKWTDADYRVVQGEQLASLKKDLPAWGIAGNVNSLPCVSMAGLHKILLVSRAKPAQKFREFLLTQSQEMFKELTVAAHSHPNRVTLPSRATVPSSSSLDEFKRLSTWMRKQGLISTDEMRGLAYRAVELLLQRVAKDQGVSMTAPLPTPTEPKTPLLPAQNTIPHAPPESRLLIGPHPKCPGFLPAEDIGKPYGMSADFVKGFLKKYLAELNAESPRALAEQYQDLHKTKPVDALGYLAFHHPTLSAYAKYEEISGGKLVWRNYWSPDIVQEIRSRIEASIAEKKSDGAQKNFTGMSPQA